MVAIKTSKLKLSVCIGDRWTKAVKKKLGHGQLLLQNLTEVLSKAKPLTRELTQIISLTIDFQVEEKNINFNLAINLITII